MRPPTVATRMRAISGPSVFLEFSLLARLTSSINLGKLGPSFSNHPSPLFLSLSLSMSMSLFP